MRGRGPSMVLFLLVVLVAARGGRGVVRRRGDAEVRALLAAGAYTQAMRASDRFGDSGLTGVLIAVPEGGGLRVDTWLMSCRVLGRRLEELMFGALVRYAAENHFTHITGEYIPTAKNSQVADLY